MPGMRKPAVLLWTFISSTFLLPCLLAQDATGSVMGRIICSDGNTPARGANVYLVPLADPSSQRAKSENTESDFSGAYEFGLVRPGTYVVGAGLEGYSDDLKLVTPTLAHASFEEQQKTAAAFPQVTVMPGASARMDLVLHRAAAISGRVTVDAGGLPGRLQITATRVSAESSESGAAAETQKPDPLTQFPQSSVTDDRGAYRIAGLPAGKYRISARITESYFWDSSGKDEGVSLVATRPGLAELTVYAPEALNAADARLIEVRDADEITDADISVPTRKLHSIGGFVTSGGSPRSGVSIELQRQSSTVPYPYNALTIDGGSYRFDLLPSGAYTLRAIQQGVPNTALGSASVQLVDSDILDANIDLGSKASPSP